ncbi:uncharacterized protein LOC112553425 isoform X1 [Pomacea canaliculata]|uniref:uncharacterized protein LOC112553425 isoform X1 n=1 Tax=Pomacea canaliculata TaxID=400727 RepID=UPI000D739B01|nr:uncharacterized protein LOC112553425 isoform X1 [Pomacea canaliculata]
MEWGVTGPFNALPTELLVIIFRELSNEDRGSCCQVCKRWREEIISEPSMWQKFEVTVRPGWNWEKTRSFFGGKGPRLYLHVRHLVLNLDRRAQGPQTVYARQANAVLSSVSKLLRALPHDMTLTSFSCSGFKYYSASKDWKSRVICELCKFLRRQKRFLEEVSFTSLELLSKQSWGSLLRAVAPTDEEGGESKIRRLSLTKMLHRTATPDMYFVKTIGRFSLLEQIEITFEHLKSEIIMTLVIACPLLRRLTLLFDLSLQPYFKDQNIYLIRNVVVAKNPELRVVLWLMVGDSVCGFLVNTSMFFIQLPVEGLVVDVSSLHTVTSVVDCYLDMMGKLFPGVVVCGTGKLVLWPSSGEPSEHVSQTGLHLTEEHHSRSGNSDSHQCLQQQRRAREDKAASGRNLCQRGGIIQCTGRRHSTVEGQSRSSSSYVRPSFLKNVKVRKNDCKTIKQDHEVIRRAR